MTEQDILKTIRSRVRAAHWRSQAIALWNDFLKCLFYAGVLAAVAALAMAFLPVEFDRLPVAAGLLALSVPAGLIRFSMRKRSMTATAVAADQRLKLKEKISSALEFAASDDPDETRREWKRAAMMDAYRAVQRFDARRAFPWTHPKEAGWMWAPALGLFIALFLLPQFGLLPGANEAEAKTMAEAERIEKDLSAFLQKQTIEREAEEKERSEAARLNEEIQKLATKLSKGQIEKREAMASLSSMEQEWQKRRESLMERIPQVNPGADPSMKKLTGGLMKQLQNGDFESASKTMQTLQKQVKMGTLSPEDLKRLGEEMKQLSGLMDMNLPLSKLLEGLSDTLGTGDMQLTQNALKMAEGELMDINETLEQMALLEAALKDLKNAKLAMSGKQGQCKKCGSLFNSDGECSGSCSGNGNKPSPFAKTGPWKAGDSRNQGAGMGGPGIGRGGNAPFAETSVQTTPEQLRSKMLNGPITGILPVDGQGVFVDATLEGGEALFEYTQAAEEALEKEQVPAMYRQPVRAYFDSLQGGSADGE